MPGHSAVPPRVVGRARPPEHESGPMLRQVASAGPLEECMESVGYGRFQRRLLLLCGVGYFATCSEMLVAVFIEQPVMRSFGLSKTAYAVLPMSVSTASLLTTFALGRATDAVGRKWPFVLGMLVVAFFGAASACATTWPLLVLCRCGVGIGNGCLAVVDYVVFIECTPASRRGRSSMAIFVSGCLGVLYVAGLAISPLKAVAGAGPEWRVLLVLASLPMFVTIALRAMFAEETPHYLASRGRYAEAYDVLSRILAVNGAAAGCALSREDFARRMAEDGGAASCLDSRRGAGVCEVLRCHGCRSTSALALIWLLQAAAYWGLTLFLPVFLTRCGVRADLTIFCMVLAELPGGVAAAVLMDRCGRVATMRGFLAAACAFAVLTTVASATGGGASLVLGSVGVYMFMIPVWSILFVLTPEAYPTSMRARASSIFQTIQGIPGCCAPLLSAVVVSQRPTWLYMALWSLLLGLNAVVAQMLPVEKRIGLGMREEQP